MEDKNVLASLEIIYMDLFEQEKKVADYILAHPLEVTNMSVTELAEKSGASEATIMRLSKKSGCKGFYHFKISLARSLNNKDEITKLSIDLADYDSSIQNIFHSKIEELKQSADLLDSTAVKKSLELIKNCDNLYIFGAGNTNPLAVYAAYQFNQFGVKAIVNVGPEMQTNAAFSMTEKDVCLLISNSGSTNMILDIANIAHQKAVPSIAITSYAKSPLVRLVDHVIMSFTNEKLRFEAISSTRMPQMTLIDMLILLISSDKSGNYKRYSSDREEYLAKYKT